jgi:hypothetical protein
MHPVSLLTVAPLHFHDRVPISLVFGSMILQKRDLLQPYAGGALQTVMVALLGIMVQTNKVKDRAV